MSASGPFCPIFFGVWQSWQPPPITSFFPRSTWDRAGAAAGVSPDGCAGRLQPARTTARGRAASTSTARQTNRMGQDLLIWWAIRQWLFDVDRGVGTIHDPLRAPRTSRGEQGAVGEWSTVESL